MNAYKSIVTQLPFEIQQLVIAHSLRNVEGLDINKKLDTFEDCFRFIRPIGKLKIVDNFNEFVVIYSICLGLVNIKLPLIQDTLLRYAEVLTLSNLEISNSLNRTFSKLVLKADQITLGSLDVPHIEFTTELLNKVSCIKIGYRKLTAAAEMVDQCPNLNVLVIRLDDYFHDLRRIWNLSEYDGISINLEYNGKVAFLETREMIKLLSSSNVKLKKCEILVSPLDESLSYLYQHIPIGYLRFANQMPSCKLINHLTRTKFVFITYPIIENIKFENNYFRTLMIRCKEIKNCNFSGLPKLTFLSLQCNRIDDESLGTVPEALRGKCLNLIPEKSADQEIDKMNPLLSVQQ